MKKLLCLLFVFFTMLYIECSAQSPAVQSALINLGTNSCGSSSPVTFSSIGNPNTNPYTIASCDLSSIFSDIYNKFIAYNPKDNKIYVNDISHGDSRVYVFDMGLPNNYTCPATIPQTPTYEYSYVPNNWEFDINGNVWCIRSLNGAYATIERIDETTGNILATKTLDFPSDNIPNTLSSGDIVILPNGRLFIAMGSSPTKFYEVTNYSSGTGDAVATFIQNMPKPCYGILYLNGTIELTGTDFGSNCYKYLYDIPSGVMSAEQPFQLGMSPIDNASISPAIGLSKQLTATNWVDSTTADITYEIYAKNMGNVKLNNFNVSDNLVTTFGTGNVGQVTVNIDSSANPSRLVLNSSYDGINNIKIFNDNQVLSNLANGYVNFTLKVRAYNLTPDQTYFNSAISTGQIGEDGLKVSVIDSSNNGSAAAIDPNSDGDAGDRGENTPTPFFFGFVLPVQFTNVAASHTLKYQNTINWSIGVTQTVVSKFEVEYSDDGIQWNSAGIVNGIQNQTSYFLDHTIYSDKNILYRIRLYEATGKSYLSKEVMVKGSPESKIIVLPVPADDAVTVNSTSSDFTSQRKIYIINSMGAEVYEHNFATQNIYIHTSSYPDGYYIINVLDKGTISSNKILIRHH